MIFANLNQHLERHFRDTSNNGDDVLSTLTHPGAFLRGCIESSQANDRITKAKAEELQKDIEKLLADFHQATLPSLEAFLNCGDQADDIERGDAILQEHELSAKLERHSYAQGVKSWSKLVELISTNIPTNNEVFFVIDYLFRTAFPINFEKKARDNIRRLNPDYLEARSKLHSKLKAAYELNDATAYEAMIETHVEELRQASDLSSTEGLLTFTQQYADFRSDYPEELYTRAGTKDKAEVWKFLQSV